MNGVSDAHVRPRPLAVAARGVFVALAAAVLLALVEVVYVLVVRRPDLSPGQVAQFALQALALMMGAGALMGMVQGPLMAAVVLLARRLPLWRSDRGLRTAAVGALLTLPAQIWFAWQLLSGRRAALLPLRPLLLAACVASGLAAVFWGIRLLLAAHRRLEDGRWAWSHAWPVVAGLVLLAVAGYVADQRVLPGLYPALHWALAVVTVGLVQAAASLLLRTWWASVRVRARIQISLALPLLVLLALAGARWAWTSLSSSEPLRYVTFGHTVLEARVAGLARAWLPAAPDRVPARPGAPRRPKQHLRPGPRAPSSSLLLITVDALRADHMGLYGYHRPTTPGMDRWAQDAVVFERAYCPTPHTSYSLISLLSGRPVNHGDPAPRSTLARWLREHGYHTAAFFPPAVFYTDGDRFRALEQARLGFRHVDYAHRDARARVDRALAHLRGLPPGQRFFAWVHLFEPHEPYAPPAGLAFGPRDVDRYDGEVLAADRQVARLVEAVRRLRPHTAVALTADHGEAFGEHGAFYHGNSLFEEQVRVPAVVSVPGVPGRRVAGAVSSVDLMPTLLAVAGVKAQGQVTGTDLGPWLLGEDPARLPPVLVRLYDRSAVIRGSWKLIHHASWDYRELYDLRADPGERRNLVSYKPHLAAALQVHLALPARRTAPPRIPTRWSPDSVAALSTTLRETSDVYRRLELIRELGSTMDSAAAAVLQEQLSEPRTRLEALQALGQVRARAAVPQLIRSLDSDPYVTWRRAAAFSLGRIGGPRARAALQRSVVEELEPAVAAQALEAMGRLGALPPKGARPITVGTWRCIGEVCTMALDVTCDPTLELLVLLDGGTATSVQCGGRQVASLDMAHARPGEREPDRQVPAMVTPLTGGILSLVAGRGTPRVRYLGLRRSPAARSTR